MHIGDGTHMGGGSFKFDNEHLERKERENMAKIEAQEKVERKKLWKHRAWLVWEHMIGLPILIAFTIITVATFIFGPVLLISKFIPGDELQLFLCITWVGFSGILIYNGDEIVKAYEKIKAGWNQ